jgi:hypothetical protein
MRSPRVKPGLMLEEAEKIITYLIEFNDVVYISRESEDDELRLYNLV